MQSARKYLKDISFEFIYRRPLFYICIAYICGIALYYTLRPPTALPLIIFFAAAALSLLIKDRRDITPLILILVMVFGVFYSALFFNDECTYEPGREYDLEAVVNDAPVIEDGRTSYIVKPQNGQAILLRVYDPSKNYGYGDELRVRVKIETPKGETNPGGFNYRDYLKRKGIYALGSAREGNIQYIGHTVNLKTPLVASRLWVEDTVERLYQKQEAAFLNSLIIGDRTNLETNVENDFINTGIIHALAISGQHVNILLLFIFYILGFFKLDHTKKNTIAIAVIGFYTLMVGAMPSVARSFIMDAVILIGKTYDEETDTLSSIALAALIILFADPLQLYDIGFQLSFAATLSILLLYEKLIRMLPFKGYIAGALSLTLSAEIGVLPISVYYFYRLPIYSLLANLVVVPIIPAIFILGIISIILGGVFLPLSYAFTAINTALIRLSIVITGAISALPHSSIIIQRPYAAVIIAYYLLALLVFGFIKSPHREYIIPALAVFIVFGVCYQPIYRGMNVTFIDVGQGDSSLVRMGTTKMIIDGGGSVKTKYSDFDVGEDVLIPYLLADHVRDIDAVFISHGDNDHMGGIIPLIENIRVGHIFLGEQPKDNPLFDKLKQIADSRDIPITLLSRGDKLRLGKADIYVLNPSDVKTDINNDSLVFKLSYGDTDILYTGDIEMEGERGILESGLNIDTEVLKVAHHGSSTSSTEAFLNSASPKISVISVGKNNYGHPNEGVLSRLSGYSEVYRTDRDGAVIINTDGSYLKVKKWSDHNGL